MQGIGIMSAYSPRTLTLWPLHKRL
jgi:hypothetical protein